MTTTQKLPADVCPICEKRWGDHMGLETVVHREKIEHSEGCRCPVFFPNYCPVHQS